MQGPSNKWKSAVESNRSEHRLWKSFTAENEAMHGPGTHQ